MRNGKRNFAPYLMLLPWVIGFIIFKVYPIVISFVYSLMEYPILGDPEFIGLGNYAEIFLEDDVFQASIIATMKYVLIGTPCVLVTSFFVAYILNFKLKGVNLFRTAYYIPSILGGNVAVSILWIQLFDINGPVNMLLGIFGVNPIFWLTDESFAVITLILLKTWQFGSTMLIFLAALQNVSPSLYEAANLDGATKAQQLFRITLPIITPMLLFNMVNVLVKAFQEFNSAYLITKGGPNHTTYFLNVYIYDQAFMSGNYGYASALTWILLLIIGTLTALVFSSSKYWVYYND
ncbi:MAG: sugar ABC transporter permease [Clostridium sp.]|uniref:carbohydrate ABC transporter permease n=1 Tax=Clostridium sp. TaxID=1506 RepID=UPI002908FCA5|nr:sugar ABC transporter permease [Clostridium sp.]MDU7337622.1 sugar ABC transporter permease [Clostridium sp.]